MELQSEDTLLKRVRCKNIISEGNVGKNRKKLRETRRVGPINAKPTATARVDAGSERIVDNQSFFDS
ncbi:hypothetical protein CRP01_18745 [Flavilitoribacter nigricans DSM 23189 = NBRC 102662]|uniref:Uncharacterized protein n=1 Tax=Flavilitoribacter nigricans (strain ATCC 23147 / DSM 23189 / NBRC 102662 / NCIMB 1420 / SS-2) TaxID=1122177 RepID=A0A2D0N974_FLAN2|nr:hypothetical protein CRP01_18745 [Flavilitoribacter nigricans DSM 23189 = NBRC 102662]